MRKTGPVGQRVTLFGYYLTQIHHMLHGLHANLIYSRTEYDVTSYFRSAFMEVRETAENAASDGFGSNFSGAAFYLPDQLMGIFEISNLSPRRLLAFEGRWVVIGAFEDSGL